jgi:flagellar basal-body rod modification protein FlgD
MAAAAAIFAHRMAPGQALAGDAAQVKPMDSSSSGSSTSSSNDSATISANDFLSLLVTEMQNQDPTSDTDPNEYVDQLVQVNSLEQLISINQTLTTSLDPSSSTPGSSGDAAGGKISAAPIDPVTNAAHPMPSTAAHKPTALAATSQAPGNLSVPVTNPAAQRVGHALDGRARNKPTPTIGRFPAAI